MVASCAFAGLVCACTAEPDGVASSTRAQCVACHDSARGGIIAPPFATISRRYADNPQAAAVLSESLKNGSHGKWAQYPGGAMPPQDQLSDDDNKALVEWILKH